MSVASITLSAFSWLTEKPTFLLHKSNFFTIGDRQVEVRSRLVSTLAAFQRKEDWYAFTAGSLRTLKAR
jgi:hypothetical protein